MFYFQEGSENLDLEMMVDDFVTFFLAGQETTANTLAFCFLAICQTPNIIEKAREEIDRVVGERTEFTYQEINDLKYCAAIFKETLRIYPPVTLIERRIAEPMNIGGYEIPKDTPIWVCKILLGYIYKYI